MGQAQQARQQSAALGIELFVQHGVGYLHDRDLHRAWVFEQRQPKHGREMSCASPRCPQLAANLVEMKVAIIAIAQRRRPAERAAGVDVVAGRLGHG
jgi:hypothetical protein